MNFFDFVTFNVKRFYFQDRRMQEVQMLRNCSRKAVCTNYIKYSTLLTNINRKLIFFHGLNSTVKGHCCKIAIIGYFLYFM